MTLLAWTAAFAVLFCAAVIILLGILALLSRVLPPGRGRTACELLLALLGLVVVTLLLWQ